MLNSAYAGAMGLERQFALHNTVHEQAQSNMVNKINKERWRSMNATPMRPFLFLFWILLWSLPLVLVVWSCGLRSLNTAFPC
jgi:hypothetical protein